MFTRRAVVLAAVPAALLLTGVLDGHRAALAEDTVQAALDRREARIEANTREIRCMDEVLHNIKERVYTKADALEVLQGQPIDGRGCMVRDTLRKRFPRAAMAQVDRN